MAAPTPAEERRQAVAFASQPLSVLPRTLLRYAGILWKFMLHRTGVTLRSRPAASVAADALRSDFPVRNWPGRYRVLGH